MTLCLFACATTAIAQPQIDWWREYRYNGNYGYFNDIYITEDGGLALVGITHDEGQDGGNCWLLRTDRGEDIIFSRAYELDPPVRVGRALIETDDGGFAIAGTTNVSQARGMKTDRDGNSLWSLHLGGDIGGWVNAVIELKAGTLVFAGADQLQGHNVQGYLAFVDQDGNLSNEYRFGEDNKNEGFYGLREVADEGIVAGGYRTTLNEPVLFWLVKTDFNGNLIWEKTYPAREAEDERLYELVSCQGGFALAGKRGEIVGDIETQFLLKRVDSAGELLWSEEYDINQNAAEHCFGLKKCPTTASCCMESEIDRIIMSLLLAL